MTTGYSEREMDLHDKLLQRGCSLIEGRILLDGSSPQGKPWWITRKKLRDAISCFEQVLAINPQNWSSIYMLGKIHQRLGDQKEALKWFSRACEINPDQPDVAREAALSAIDTGDGKTAVRYCEAALSAIDTGDGKTAVRYCEAAIRMSPDDFGLILNLALAHLIAGDLTQAQACAEDAVRKAPNDKISKRVRAIINEVADGKRRPPKTGLEIR
ncbi:tetratricopeptide repeat protein [bacterium]|nr:tetratricopeptide repeat protein [bacterium]